MPRRRGLTLFAHCARARTFANTLMLGANASEAIGEGTLFIDGTAAASTTSTLTVDASGLAPTAHVKVLGGAGNDVLGGGAGSDTLGGGAGDDTFKFDVAGALDRILDFHNASNHASESDVLAVSAAGFGCGLSAGMDVSGVFESSNDNLFQSSDARFHYDTSSGTLYYSAAGAGGTAIALAQLEAGVTLHPQDLHVVA